VQLSLPKYIATTDQCDMLIRFSSSNLKALCAAYISLTGAPSSALSNLEISIPRNPHPNNIPEISSKAIKSILMGCMTMGFSIMFGTNLKVLGLCISITGGIISMMAGFGQMFGMWDWVEDRLDKERQKDLDRLGRVMGMLRAKGGSEEVISMAKEQVGEIRLQTAYGILVTRRKDGREGFIVSLEKEKGEVGEADLIWTSKLTGGQDWVNRAEEVVVGEEWSYLLNLSR